MSQTTSRVTSTWSTGTGPPPEISYHSWTSLEECTDRELSGKRERERERRLTVPVTDVLLTAEED